MCSQWTCQALLHATHIATPSHLNHLRVFSLSTYGIIFLGTPHQGTDVAKFAQLSLRALSVIKPTNMKVLQHLLPSSEVLQNQLTQYASIAGNFDTKFYYETLATRLVGGSEVVVSSMCRHHEIQ